jgi:hypothetical protein
MANLTEALQRLKKGELSSDVYSDDEKQFIVRENRKKPGEPIFVREDGKVGFPTINSIAVKIGDIARGKIVHEEPTYFLAEIREVK